MKEPVGLGTNRDAKMTWPNGSRVKTKEEPVWCPECGKVLPWKHKHQPTLRARVCNWLIYQVVKKIETAVEDFRDTPRGKR